MNARDGWTVLEKSTADSCEESASADRNKNVINFSIELVEQLCRKRFDSRHSNGTVPIARDHERQAVRFRKIEQEFQDSLANFGRCIVVCDTEQAGSVCLHLLQLAGWY